MTRLNLIALASAVLAVLVLAPAAPAATGGRDTTFNGTGEARLEGGMNAARSVAVQRDGKLVVVGETFAFAAGRIHRLNPDGTPDTTFGDRGVIAVDGPKEDRLQAVLLQPDGKIVAGGSADGKAVIYRFDELGRPDPGFGTGGRATLTTDAAKEQVEALALQADGKIIAAGVTSAGFGDAVVWRRSGGNGAADLNFNAGGKLSIAFGVVSQEIANGVVVQPNGKLVVVGNTSEATDGFVARLDATAGLDPTFRGNGKFVLNHGGGEFATAVALQPDGKILVTGHTTIGLNGFVNRLLDTGQPDQSFNSSGVQFLDGDGSEFGNEVLVQPDRKLVIVGSTTAGDGDGAVYRLRPDGSFDSSFDGDGRVTVSSGRSESLFAGALQPDGNIAGVGTSFGVGMVYRLLGDPHTLTVRTAGPGTVTSSPGGIACGGDCSEAYDVGTRVALTAAPAAGGRFEGWSGVDCASGTAPTVCSVTLRQALTARATFTAIPQPPAAVAPTAGPATSATGGGGAAATRDTIPPRISKARLTNRRFSLGSRITATVAKRGTGVRFTLSESAAVTLTVVRGRNTVATLKRSRATAGENLVAYSGRTRGTRLKPGRYRMVLVATDAAGNRSAPVTLAFRVTRGG